MEEDEEISTEEAQDTFFNSGKISAFSSSHLQIAEVVGDKDTLLLNASKVLRHGKVVSNGGEMSDLTEKIKEVMLSINKKV